MVSGDDTRPTPEGTLASVPIDALNDPQPALLEQVVGIVLVTRERTDNGANARAVLGYQFGEQLRITRVQTVEVGRISYWSLADLGGGARGRGSKLTRRAQWYRLPAESASLLGPAAPQRIVGPPSHTCERTAAAANDWMRPTRGPWLSVRAMPAE